MPFREGQGHYAAEYAALLSDAGCPVDAWETTYIHELTGETSGVGVDHRYRAAAGDERLSETPWQQFRQELIPMLDEAYPARPDGRTFFPFRRVFVVAQVG